MAINSFTLITGATAITGQIFDPQSTNYTIFYSFSGLTSNSSVTFNLEARDPLGNVGYQIDSISLTGRSVKNIAFFQNTPIGNGIRGTISSIVAGSGYCFINSAT